MGITELVKAVGDDHIEVQSVHQNYTTANVCGKGSLGKITFNTSPDKVLDLMRENESKFIGMVLWMHRDRVDAAMNSTQST